MKKLLRYRLLLLALLTGCCIISLKAQEETFRIKMETDVDTLIEDVATGEEEQQKTSNFYDSLKIKAYKKRWSRELYNIFISSSGESKSDSISAIRTELKYADYAGYRIRKIQFVKLNPFGTSLNKLNSNQDSWLIRTGNALHVKTNDYVLRRNLIFQEGDQLKPNVIADFERLLRKRSYIEDVRIEIKKVHGVKNEVDVIVISKDVWSKAFFIEPDKINTGKIELWDRNIFGTGNSFQNNIHWDPVKSGILGYEAFYMNQNLMGTFIESRFSYSNVFETESMGINLIRSFFTPSIKYAGGFSAFRNSTERNIWWSDTFYTNESLRWDHLDLWFGRSFSLSDQKTLSSRRLNLLLSARLYKNIYHERPEETCADMLYDYHNKTIWLNSIALSSQSFYRSNLIYSYGPYEDISEGWLVNFTFGKEFSEFKDRTYGTLSLSTGGFLKNIGYAYSRLEISAFTNDFRNVQQGVIQFDLNYFTNLFIMNRFKFRHFITFNYLEGINRFELEKINLNNHFGLRGLSRNEIYGQKRISLNLETISFTPFHLYGFRFAIFAFSDWGLIGGEKELLKDLNAYYSLGTGVRIRNERLVFPTIQFRLTFYPNIPEMNAGDVFHFSGEKKLNPPDFNFNAPKIQNYR